MRSYRPIQALTATCENHTFGINTLNFLGAGAA